MPAPARRGRAAMPAIDLHAPVLGPPGQPCAACGEPLAADQRYCLSCGERRGPPRLDPLAHARGARRGRGRRRRPPPTAGARRATAWPLPSRRVAGVATLLMLAFGIAAGAAAGPHAGATLASASRASDDRRRPAARGRGARRAARPEPAQPSPPDTATADTSTPESSTADSSARRRPPADTSAPDASSPALDAGQLDPGVAEARRRRHARVRRLVDDAARTATFKHVWIVALTGHTMDEALADPSPMPYLAGTLRPKGTAALGLQAGARPAAWPTSSRSSAASGRRRAARQLPGLRRRRPEGPDGLRLRQGRRDAPRPAHGRRQDVARLRRGLRRRPAARHLPAPGARRRARAGDGAQPVPLLPRHRRLARTAPPTRPGPRG